jgi:dynein heavy chain
MFAQMKNFIGRCNNLKEICECISQFMIDVYPRFGGTQGEEIKKNFIEIRRDFKAQLDEVKGKKETILDTHATNWHDDFDKFRNAIKDMEKKCCNIIDSAFVNQKSVRECLYLINNFFNISVRRSIKDHLRTKV